MPLGQLPLEDFHARSTGRRRRSRPRTCWEGYISHLAWECLKIPQEERKNIAEERNVLTRWMDAIVMKFGKERLFFRFLFRIGKVLTQWLLMGRRSPHDSNNSLIYRSATPIINIWSSLD